MPATIFAVDGDRTWSIDRLVGRSPALLELRDTIQRIARESDSPVLFLGETGTGRSLAARILHHLSVRGSRPYASIACKSSTVATLHETIFGIDANPGARVETRPAVLESLHGGTLFLNGVHATDKEVQQKLLRFLDQRGFTRVGGATRINADVRILASSDRRLDEALEAGRFARELHDRLSASVVRLPPLRARAADIEPLVQHYLAVFTEELGKQVDGVTPEALEALETYSWPGNIRELRTVIERGVLVADGDRLQAAHLAVPAWRREGSDMDLPATGVNLELLERSLVLQALQRTGGNQTRAAALLGLNRDQVRYRIEKFGLPRP
jgi:two-component system response regulator AtoC